MFVKGASQRPIHYVKQKRLENVKPYARRSRQKPALAGGLTVLSDLRPLSAAFDFVERSVRTFYRRAS
jgi:hypothetical protein